MYSKEFTAGITQRFWETFGKYMAPVPSATGEKVNWVNYKTGVKGIRIFQTFDRGGAGVGLKIENGEKAELYQAVLENTSTDLEGFEKHLTGDGGMNLEARLNKKDLYNEQDWPEVISFLKQKLIALDAYWADNKFIFEMQ